MSIMTAPMFLSLACELSLKMPAHARWCAMQAQLLCRRDSAVHAAASALLGALS